MKVWVLDLFGYDARGGNAAVFSTAEKAKASVGWVEWEEDEDGWIERDELGSTRDLYTLKEVEVQ